MSNGVVFFLLVLFFVVAASWKPKGSGGSDKEANGKQRTVHRRLGEIEVKSSSDPSTRYLLTPEDIRCTCPDWEKKRASRDFRGKPERVCKHLAQYYAAHPANVPQSLKPWLPFIERMAAKGWGLPTTNVLYIDDESLDGVVIDCYPYLTRGWVDVYIQDAKFGYNPKEQRWAGNDEPIHSEQWLDIIEQMLGYLEPQTGNSKNLAKRPRQLRKGTLYLQVVEFCRMKRSTAVVDISKHFGMTMEEAAQLVEQMKQRGDMPYDDADIYAEAVAFCQEQNAVVVSLLQRALGMDFVTASVIAERIKKEKQSGFE